MSSSGSSISIIQIDQNIGDWNSQFLKANNHTITNTIQDKITTLYLLHYGKLLTLVSLDDIFVLSEEFIKGIIMANGHQDQGLNTNRLSVTIILYNLGLINPDDYTYIQNPKFNDVFLVSDSADNIRTILSKSQNTNVVCVKVGDIRPKYNDLEEWETDPNNVYIGRKGVVFVTRNGNKYRYPPKDSIWANPYKIKNDLTREQVIDMYRTYITNKINSGEITREQLESLRGKTLGCWCKEKGQNIPCHGDVLVEILEQYVNM